ncbi:MAG: hypothetical protein MUF34_34405 [Polyangiaceae bacterium]|jgi:hypothetical protein|nr:hypothetical protein [Polyangiaceae bacterium]
MNDKKHFCGQVLATVARAKEALASLQVLDPDLILQVELPEFQSNTMVTPKRQAAQPPTFALRA